MPPPFDVLIELSLTHAVPCATDVPCFSPPAQALSLLLERVSGAERAWRLQQGAVEAQVAALAAIGSSGSSSAVAAASGRREEWGPLGGTANGGGCLPWVT